MPMTRAEKAAVADLEKQVDGLRRSVAMARALRWPDYPMPEPMTKEEIERSLVDGGERYGRRQRVAFGFFADVHSRNIATDERGSVSSGCSNGVNHGSGDTTTSQGPGRMYRTELDAWKSIRIRLTEEFAANLVRIDEKIAALTGGPE